MAATSVPLCRRKETLLGGPSRRSLRHRRGEQAARRGTDAQVPTRLRWKGGDDELAPFTSAFTANDGKRGQTGSVEPMYPGRVEPDIVVRVPENVQQDPGTLRVECAACREPAIGCLQSKHGPLSR